MVLQTAQKPELVRTDASTPVDASASGGAVTAPFQTGADLFDERILRLPYCNASVGEIVMTGIPRTWRRNAVTHASGRTAPAKPHGKSRRRS
jgi:hypothetical protein